MPLPVDFTDARAPRMAVASAVPLVMLSMLAMLAGCLPLRPPGDSVTQVPAPEPPPPIASAAAGAPVELPPLPPVPTPPPPPAPRPEPADLVARQFLAASERMRALGNADLVREVVRLSEGPQSPANTLEMALGLGLTRNGGDVARAIGILDPLARSNSPDVAPWQPWARLLLARYIEQRRIEEQLDRQSQQVREHLRRIELLNSQLESLKAIERSMTPRPAGTPPTNRGGAP